MAELGNTPFTSIEDYRVAVDAPVSTNLMVDMVVDINHLYSRIADGSDAVAGVSTTTLAASGNGTIGGNMVITGNLEVGGIFTVSELLYFLTAL